MVVHRPNRRIAKAEVVIIWVITEVGIAFMVLVQLPRQMTLEAADLNICLPILYTDLG